MIGGSGGTGRCGFAFGVIGLLAAGWGDDDGRWPGFAEEGDGGIDF